MSFGYDPEVPAGYQDADIELAEMHRQADLTTSIPTPPCPVCGKSTVFTLRVAAYDAWRRGTLIQDAFPEMSIDDRETLKTGFCGPCFESLFYPEPEAEPFPVYPSVPGH